jgi:hypothetical protein
MAKVNPFVGLFGTCGNSTWRRRFIEFYREHGVRYFNPQVENWTPECADIEAQHLKTDQVILFPITGETYGSGSLAETGFSVMQVVSSIYTSPTRFLVVMIEDDLDTPLKDNDVAYKESIRARKLVKAHLKANPHPNVFIVESFSEMLGLSLELYSVVDKVATINDFYRKVG